MRVVPFLILILALWIAPQEIAVAQDTDITLPTYRGYIDVAPGGRYFVDEDGKGFLVIGQNDAVSWPGPMTLLNDLQPSATEAYIQDLRDHGITVSRIMIEYAQFPRTYFENPVGTFDPVMVKFWDDFIALAEKHGLYLLLTPYDTFWQAEHWAQYPYSAEQGGPCERKRDWLTGRACIDAQKERWRFILERWGGSPNIMAWDIMNEIDIWWGASAAEIDAYVTEMAAFITEVETAKWGRSRLLTVSSAAPLPDGDLGRVIYNHPALDFANTHLYIGNSRAPSEPITSATAIAGGVVLSLEAIRDDRPYTDTESGPIDSWIADPKFDAEYHHNMSWAHLAAGGAGSGMRWPYTTPHWILPEMRDNLLGLARFATQIDWANFHSEPIGNNILPDSRAILRAGCSDGDTAIVWLLLDSNADPAPAFDGHSITINRTFEDGDYTVEFWETYGGNRLASVTATVEGGSLKLTLNAADIPGLADLKDLALLIKPA